MIESPLKAIKQFCYECSGENHAEVKRCSSENCPLKPFRFGHNPFRKGTELSEERKMQMAENLKNAREKKGGAINEQITECIPEKAPRK